MSDELENFHDELTTMERFDFCCQLGCTFVVLCRVLVYQSIREAVMSWIQAIFRSLQLNPRHSFPMKSKQE